MFTRSVSFSTKNLWVALTPLGRRTATPSLHPSIAPLARTYLTFPSQIGSHKHILRSAVLNTENATTTKVGKIGGFFSSIRELHVGQTGFPKAGFTQPTVFSLEDIRQAKGDINAMRMLFKGNLKTCHKLFKEAVKQEDVISQIQLSHALFGMKWGKDDSKDFSSLSARDLETFSYYPKEFALFNSAYDQVMEVESDWRTHDTRGAETFRAAASRDYLPAFLELKCKEWKGHTSSYGFGVELRPFAGKGDRKLDYYFGEALKNGSQIGSELYYEGMYWMNQSLGIPVKYPRAHQSFKDFTSSYVRYEDCMSTYYYHDGLYHVGSSVVLAPSREAWESFVKEKLGDVKFAPMESYSFRYDTAQILSLLNEHKISAVCTSSFVESTTEGRDIESFRGGTFHGFRIYSLSIYQGKKSVGEISVQENTFKIHQTFENPTIKPIIDFIENVMIRTGSADAAHSWLKQMGGMYI